MYKALPKLASLVIRLYRGKAPHRQVKGYKAAIEAFYPFLPGLLKSEHWKDERQFAEWARKEYAVLNRRYRH